MMFQFQGRCDDLKDHVYDSSGSRLSKKLFTRTTKAIGEYVACEYTGADEFCIWPIRFESPNADSSPST